MPHSASGRRASPQKFPRSAEATLPTSLSGPAPSCALRAGRAHLPPLGTQRLAQRLAHSELSVSVGGRVWASVRMQGFRFPPGGMSQHEASLSPRGGQGK